MASRTWLLSCYLLTALLTPPHPLLLNTEGPDSSCPGTHFTVDLTHDHIFKYLYLLKVPKFIHAGISPGPPDSNDILSAAFVSHTLPPIRQQVLQKHIQTLPFLPMSSWSKPPSAPAWSVGLASSLLSLLLPLPASPSPTQPESSHYSVGQSMSLFCSPFSLFESQNPPWCASATFPSTLTVTLLSC